MHRPYLDLNHAPLPQKLNTIFDGLQLDLNPQPFWCEATGQPLTQLWVDYESAPGIEPTTSGTREKKIRPQWLFNESKLELNIFFKLLRTIFFGNFFRMALVSVCAEKFRAPKFLHFRRRKENSKIKGFLPLSFPSITFQIKIWQSDHQIEFFAQ